MHSSLWNGGAEVNLLKQTFPALIDAKENKIKSTKKSSPHDQSLNAVQRADS